MFLLSDIISLIRLLFLTLSLSRGSYMNICLYICCTLVFRIAVCYSLALFVFTTVRYNLVYVSY